MFARAGKNVVSGEKYDGNSLRTEAPTQSAVAILSALSPWPSPQTTGESPGKLIDSSSKCYKQLSDLNNLILLNTSLKKKCDCGCFEEAKLKVLLFICFGV